MERVLEIRKLTGGRYLVCLDDGLQFPLYRKEITELDLCEGEYVSAETLSQILHELLPKRARLRALHLLEKMDRTEYQLREKLRLSAYPEEIIEDAVSYVKRCHYIDDLRYARNYVESHISEKSIRQLENEMYTKGIPRELISQVLSESELPDEEAQIRKLLAKKHYDPLCSDQKERQKIYAFLMRRGYNMSAIMHVLNCEEE
ncbi:MAG: regulatory protein RecX [Lachnospiraceae bacterium]|nr:regulatory protein RecX [Lachnospiraceae bacterium]